MSTLADREAWRQEEEIDDPWTGIVWCRVYVEEMARISDTCAEVAALKRATCWLPDVSESNAKTEAVIVNIDTPFMIHPQHQCTTEYDARLKACDKLNTLNKLAHEMDQDVPRIIDIQAFKTEPM